MEANYYCYGSNLLLNCYYRNVVWRFSDFLEWYCIAGDLSVVISCASLALADAGIMMYDLITAVSVVCVCYYICTNSCALSLKFISIR